MMRMYINYLYKNVMKCAENKKRAMLFASLFCGEYRIRTDDLLHAMQAL